MLLLNNNIGGITQADIFLREEKPRILASNTLRAE